MPPDKPSMSRRLYITRYALAWPLTPHPRGVEETAVATYLRTHLSPIKSGKNLYFMLWVK